MVRGWASPRDGHVLAHHWSVIDARCDTAWSQYHAQPALSPWLQEQTEGHVTVPCLDVWALTERAKNVLQANCSRVVD
ncbi:hypothetical protein OH817_05840 [Kocuria rhizophila]|uniref:hypothetical protein n=1 Tax=Kocuria rhizophila TaxID=72000 RepID=UPI002ED1DF85|nr:hypothetical protein OH817_05840 [Kocuria rhizophila]